MPTVKAKPLTWQEVSNLLVTDADAFTALRYLRHRESVPALLDLEAKGDDVLPGIEGSLCDLYHALWSPDPSVRDEVRPDRKYWRELLGQTLKTSVYGELHAETQLSELKSVLGTIATGESVLAMIPKKDREKLKELGEAQAEADKLDGEAEAAKAEAEAAGELAEAAAKSAGKPGQTGGAPQSGMSPEAAKGIANQLAEQAATAKAKADATRADADAVKTKAESLADALMGKPGSKEAEEKLRELARIGLQAARDAKAKVEEVSSTIEAWGLEEGELHRESIPEALGLLERMKRNQHLKKFAALLGRIRKIAARKARAKVSGQGVRVAIPETGRDLRRAERSELVAITHPALRAKAFRRWTQGELRLRGEKTEQKLGHGPVIVCEDGSGSMEGAKQQWAKAVTLSLAHYAKLQRRSFGWILFDYGVRQSKTYPQGRLSAGEMLELAESRAGGGTNFEQPLRKAVEMIQKEGLKKADICFITDGECAVSDQFPREFRAAKKALEFNVIAVLCDVGSSADKTVREFSDRIEKASAFTADEAEQKIFSHF